MIQESYRGYFLTATPQHTRRNRWTVAVTISRNTAGGNEEKRFTAADGIEYILEIEAAKEGLNLGRNLIKNNCVGF